MYNLELTPDELLTIEDALKLELSMYQGYNNPSGLADINRVEALLNKVKGLSRDHEEEQ